MWVKTKLSCCYYKKVPLKTMESSLDQGDVQSQRPFLGLWWALGSTCKGCISCPLFDLKPSQLLRAHLRMLHEVQDAPRGSGVWMVPSRGAAPCWEVSVTPVTRRGWVCHAVLTGGFLQSLSWGRRQQLRVGTAQGEGGVS